MAITDASLNPRDVHLEATCDPWFPLAIVISSRVRDASLNFRDVILSIGNYILGVFM